MIYDDTTSPSDRYVAGNTEQATFCFLGGGAWLFEENGIYITTENSYATRLGNFPRMTSPNGGIYSISGNYVNVSPLADTSQGENTLFTYNSFHNITKCLKFPFPIRWQHH